MDDHLPVALLQGEVSIKVDALRIPGHRAVQKQQGIGRRFFQAGDSAALFNIFKIELWVCDCGHTRLLAQDARPFFDQDQLPPLVGKGGLALDKDERP